MLNCTPFHKGTGALVSHSGGKCHLQGPCLPVETCTAVWPPAPTGVMCGKGGWWGRLLLLEALGWEWGPCSGASSPCFLQAPLRAALREFFCTWGYDLGWGQANNLCGHVRAWFKAGVACRGSGCGLWGEFRTLEEGFVAVGSVVSLYGQGWQGQVPLPLETRVCGCQAVLSWCLSEVLLQGW